MSNSKNKLYNFIVNTYGLSKELILEKVDQRISDLLAKHVVNKLNSNDVEKLIANQVAKVLKEGFDTGYYSRQPLESLMKNMIDNEIKNRLNEGYTFDVKVVQKEDKVIKRVKK